MKVYGGFAGTETAISQRQISVHVTTLSGDLAGDDGPNFKNSDENAYHVVYAGTTNAPTRLDGFTVTGGNGGFGGGLLLYSFAGQPVVANCTFVRNQGYSGAGLCALNGDVVVFRCDFVENDGRCCGYGGGLCAGDDSIGSAIVLNCRFLRNRGGQGGGLAIGEGGDAFVMNCLFSGNTATRGGGFYSFYYDSAHRVVNCTFTHNDANVEAGGADRIAGLNCIFWGNTAGGAAGMAAQATPLQLSYSCIQDLSGPPLGIGNIALDPQFIDLLGPDQTAGTLDDNLRLAAGSPCIDRAFNPGACGVQLSSNESFHQVAWGNLCDFASDLDGSERYVDDPASPDCPAPASGCGIQPVIDMGAYEYDPAPTTPLIGDLNCDGFLNAADAPALAIAIAGRDAYYMAFPACQRSHADLNDDGIVDGRDVEGFVALLLNP